MPERWTDQISACFDLCLPLLHNKRILASRDMRKNILVSILCISTHCVYAQKDFGIFNDTLWTYKLRKYPNQLPLLDATSIFVGADNSPIVRLDKRTGKEIWKLDVDIAEYAKGFVHTIKDDGKGTIYFNGTSKDIFAVQKSNGKILWKYGLKFDDDIISEITILENAVYVNPAEPFFLAISTKGKVLWKTDLPGICSGYVISDDEIYCQTTNGICILNATNGQVKMIKQIFGKTSFFSFPPVSYGNLLMIGNNRDSLICFNKRTFEQVWVSVGVKQFRRENKSVYVYNDSTFSRIDINTGRAKWSIKGNFNWPIQPTEYRGNLYLQTRHTFQILNVDSGEQLFDSPFPFKSYTKPLVEREKIYLGFTENFIAVKNPMVD